MRPKRFPFINCNWYLLHHYFKKIKGLLIKIKDFFFRFWLQLELLGKFEKAGVQ